MLSHFIPSSDGFRVCYEDRNNHSVRIFSDIFVDLLSCIIYRIELALHIKIECIECQIQSNRIHQFLCLSYNYCQFFYLRKVSQLNKQDFLIELERFKSILIL